MSICAIQIIKIEPLTVGSLVIIGRSDTAIPVLFFTEYSGVSLLGFSHAALSTEPEPAARDCRSVPFESW